MPSAGELSDLRREIAALHEEIAHLKDGSGRGSRGGQPDANASSERATSDETSGGLTRDWHETTIAQRPALALLIAALIVAGIAVGGYFLWNYLHSYESTGDAKIAGTITPISSEVTGKISKVLVRNGKHVSAGELLVELDSHPYRLAVATAQAKYDAARAEAEIAKRKYQDLTNAKPGALARLRGGKQSQQDAEFEAHELLAIRLAAEHGAQAALEEARLKVQYTKITAPATGAVAQVSVSAGEVIGQSQRLMALVQSDELWVKANFKETQLRHLRVGDPVTIHVDAIGSNFAGYIESIAPATASEFSLLPAENASGNFVKVVQRIPVRIEFKAGQDRSRLRPGMSVEAKVWLQHE